MQYNLYIEYRKTTAKVIKTLNFQFSILNYLKASSAAVGLPFASAV